MFIQRCIFGSITIDGKAYLSDIIIYPDGKIDDSWWRRQSHILSFEDIEDLVASMPEVIVAGTGMDGLMKPDNDVEKLLAMKNIRFIPAPNLRAMEIFNDLVASGKKTGACFHLTC